MRLPKKDSATFRGVITSAQGFIGSLAALGFGLWLTLKGVPGCSEAFAKFVQDNLITIAGGFGVSTGAVSFLWNVIFRKDVKNY